jgi:hypothetical protein
MDCRGCGAPASSEKIAELQATKARAAVAQAARAPAQSAKPGDWMCVGRAVQVDPSFIPGSPRLVSALEGYY